MRGLHDGVKPVVLRRNVDKLVVEHSLRIHGVFGPQRTKILEDTMLLLKVMDLARKVKEKNPYTYSTLPEFNQYKRMAEDAFARIEKEMGNDANAYMKRDVLPWRKTIADNLDKIL